MGTFTTSDGTRLNFIDEGTGPAVVLVAGHTAPLSTWNPLRRALLEAGHRVVAVDRRHTGASDFPESGMRMARQGADLHGLRRELRLDGAIWVGASLGASAILAMVDVFGTAGVGPFVLVDQTPKMINEGDWDLGLYDLTWATLDEFVASFGSPEAMSVDRFRRSNTIQPPPDVLPLLTNAMSTPYPHEHVRPLLRDHAVQDWRDVLPRIDVPTLAVAGRHSEVWPVAHAEYVASHVKLGDFHVFEASGHAPMFTEPDAFNAVVCSFVAAHG